MTIRKFSVVGTTGLLMLASSAAFAQGYEFLPVLNSNFAFQPTVALSGGALFPQSGQNGTAAIGGVEFNINCGLFQTPGNNIRTHISVLDVAGPHLRAQLLEMSPRYTLPVSSTIFLDAGPAVALENAKQGETGYGRYAVHFGFGAAGGIEYRSGHTYTSLDVNYLDSTTDHGIRFESTSLIVSVGYNF